MVIEKAKEKMDAIRIAESCMNSVLTVNPNAFEMKVFATLAELKMDLLDALDEEFERSFK